MKILPSAYFPVLQNFLTPPIPICFYYHCLWPMVYLYMNVIMHSCRAVLTVHMLLVRQIKHLRLTPTGERQIGEANAICLASTVVRIWYFFVVSNGWRGIRKRIASSAALASHWRSSRPRHRLVGVHAGPPRSPPRLDLGQDTRAGRRPWEVRPRWRSRASPRRRPLLTPRSRAGLERPRGSPASSLPGGEKGGAGQIRRRQRLAGLGRAGLELAAALFFASSPPHLRRRSPPSLGVRLRRRPARPPPPASRRPATALRPSSSSSHGGAPERARRDGSVLL